MRNTLVAVSLFFAAASSGAQWQPSGQLSTVPVVANCMKTGGDIAVASPPGVIFFCPPAADALNAVDPGAGHFYFVHEFGHLALNTDVEWAADCWATQQLKAVPNGASFIAAMLSHLERRQSAFEPAHPRYGTPGARAANIRQCATER